MKKMHICTIILCLTVLAIGPALAAMGDKPGIPGYTGPAPGTLLSPFPVTVGNSAGNGGGPTGAQTQGNFRVAYWDIGLTANIYDASDVAYLQFGGFGLPAWKYVKEGAIRLTDYNVPGFGTIYTAGSVVQSFQRDCGKELMPFFPGLWRLPAGVAAGFYYQDLSNNGYTIDDPVYLKTWPSSGAPPQKVSANDIRISPGLAGYGYPAGTVVNGVDLDYDRPLTLLKPVSAFGNGLTTASTTVQLAFVDANSNGQYDTGEIVFLDTAPLGFVTGSDVEIN